MNRICTICARGGSKGVLGKNLRLMHGKPLIAYSIEQAKASGLFNAVVVSSDSAGILEAARQHGADLLIDRPADLATDTAAKLPAIRHAAEAAERTLGMRFDTYVDLDATSPLRSAEDIRNAVELLEASGAGNVITAMPARRSPYFNLVEVAQDGSVALSKRPAVAFARRQDAPPCYDMNASIYVWRRPVLFGTDTIFNPDTRLYVMPEERSIDIDSELDFEFVQFLMKRQLGE